jgi:putative peptide zinc metalloprotease protein
MAAPATEHKIFHESWYRLAGQRLSLRASVRVRRQLFRGSRWYVLHEPFTDKFFRLRPAAYELLCRLESGGTVDEVWRESVERDPRGAPGQEEVIQLLSQLYYANLLHYDLPADSEKLFERYRKQKQSERRATLRSIMFFRIPLFDPNDMLKVLLPLIRAMISPAGLVLWAAVVIGAITVVINHFPQLRLQAQGVLSLSNLPLLYLSLILIKAVHELGHAFAVRRFGGSVHTIGLMFLIFNPLPYTDSTAAWSFRNRWQRVLVGAAGMIAELFLAGLAVFVWAATGPGTLHALAYDAIFVASVSTIVFNVNPLMRFDGYYILSDLLDIPNLSTRANQHLRFLVERHAFGVRRSSSPAATRTEAAWLTVFGIASGAYKLVVFTTILLVIADRFLLLGIIMAAVCAVAWVLTPLLRLITYLASDPRLEKDRARAAGVTAGAAAIVVCLLAVVPVPRGFTAAGVLQAAGREAIVNGVPGVVQKILVPSDSRVTAGEPLVQLSDPELDARMRQIQAQMAEFKAVRVRALSSSPADLPAIDGTIASIQEQMDRLTREEKALAVTADHAGLWVAPDLDEMNDKWIPRGTPMGRLIDDSAFNFICVIPQQDASAVFSNAIRGSRVRLAGQTDATLAVTSITGIPAGQTRLPSAALGFGGGGNVATSSGDASGEVAAQSFYEMRLGVEKNGRAVLFNGISGEVRFELSPQPILQQGYRKLRQLLQARYQV